MQFGNETVPPITANATGTTLSSQINPLPTGAMSRNLKVYGHRGSIYEECENTLPGFVHAGNEGADGVELDVFKLHDGTLVCYHGSGGDKKPGLMTESHNVSKMITAVSFGSLQKLKLSSDWEEGVCGKEKLENASIPKLLDVLQFCKEAELGVKIELKGE